MLHFLLKIISHDFDHFDLIILLTIVEEYPIKEGGQNFVRIILKKIMKMNFYETHLIYLINLIHKSVETMTQIFSDENEIDR